MKIISEQTRHKLNELTSEVAGYEVDGMTDKSMSISWDGGELVCWIDRVNGDHCTIVHPEKRAEYHDLWVEVENLLMEESPGVRQSSLGFVRIVD